jgi:hypothetical protein
MTLGLAYLGQNIGSGQVPHSDAMPHISSKPVAVGSQQRVS